MTESHFQRVTRQGIEGNINHDYEQGDMFHVNEKLDILPYGRKRPEITLEQARLIARRSIQTRTRETVELPIVVVGGS